MMNGVIQIEASAKKLTLFELKWYLWIITTSTVIFNIREAILLLSFQLVVSLFLYVIVNLSPWVRLNENWRSDQLKLNGKSVALMLNLIVSILKFSNFIVVSWTRSKGLRQPWGFKGGLKLKKFRWFSLGKIRLHWIV